MSLSHLHIARLDEARLEKLRAMEDELGLSMVALEPQSGLADISDEQVQRLQAMESELGVTLLAYSRD